MANLHFARPCTFTSPEGETKVYQPGLHKDVPDDVANHWFVKAHLVQDPEEAAVPEAAPLQHEERIKMKAALDAADARSAGFEAERDAANERVAALESENATLRARVGDLEAAASESEAEAPQADGDNRPTGAAPGDDEFAGKPYGIKRRGQGKFAVVSQAADGTLAADGLSKADAQAKARELNAQG